MILDHASQQTEFARKRIIKHIKNYSLDEKDFYRNRENPDKITFLLKDEDNNIKTIDFTSVTFDQYPIKIGDKIKTHKNFLHINDKEYLIKDWEENNIGEVKFIIE